MSDQPDEPIVVVRKDLPAIPGGWAHFTVQLERVGTEPSHLVCDVMAPDPQSAIQAARKHLGEGWENADAATQFVRRQPRPISMHETNPLPGVIVRRNVHNETGEFESARVYVHGIHRSTYATETGLKRALNRLLKQIAVAEEAGGWMSWRGTQMPLHQHPATKDTPWARWTPQDGMRDQGPPPT